MKKNMIYNKIEKSADKLVKRKLRDKRGFSLAETLLAVLILLLVSVVVATGMPAATNAYNKVILGANAKVMLSTAITALHDELGTAWQVKPITGGLTYFSASTGAKTNLTKGEDGKLWVEEYVSQSDDLIHDITEEKHKEEHKDKGHLLVPDTNSKMYVTCGGITYNENTGIATISDLKILKQDGTELAKYASDNGTNFNIRVISKNAL